MLPIAGGEFWMGTSDQNLMQLQLKDPDWAYEWFDNDLFAAEQPYHPVMLEDFEIAQYPVTNVEYYQFVFATGYRLPKAWIGFSYPDDEAYHPVAGISKIDAEAYIQWLNRESRNTFRLPTEAEWERAARGTDGRIFPWGNTFDPWRCNTLESGKQGTMPVGSYSPGGDSPCGASDMVGNVWEWTSTCFGPYPYQEANQVDCQPGKKPERIHYVVRGGAWYYSRKFARCTAREGMQADFLSASLGFRLARTSKAD
jgi:formylglycine-generating enzyme required for sulfatase activity